MSRRRNASTSPGMRRAVAALLGVVMVVIAFLMESKLSILIGVFGAVILMSVIPYGSTGMRPGRRYK